MKIITKYELEDGDLELLKKGLPEHPCQKCCDHDCCDCPEEAQYEKTIKMYKDRNILDLAQKLASLCELDQKIAELQQERQEMVQAIDDQAGIPIVQLIMEKEKKCTIGGKNV